MAGKKVIAIGLDGAEPELIKKWSQQGFLPNLAKLQQKGVLRNLQSTVDLANGTTWTSINSGVTPAKHGMVYYHRQLKSGTYQIRTKKYHENICEPFWSNLSRQGKRVAIFDIPTNFPQKELNGIQILSWGTTGEDGKEPCGVSDVPPEVYEKFGRHPFENWQPMRLKTREMLERFSKGLVTGVRQRTKIAKWLQEKEDWDLFYMVFTEPHWAGHAFWHLMDEEMPTHNKIYAKDYGDVIFKVYQEVDKALGELLKDIDDKAVFIFSNTGMGPNYSARHLLPTVLARFGMDGAAWEKAKLCYFTRQFENWLRSRFVKWTKIWLPKSWWQSRQYQLENFRHNWKECSAFAVPNDHTGAIRINLKGREPLGIVEPGDSYEALCKELTNKLLQLVNPATGHKVVQEVILVRDVYRGERLNDLPDLIVKWRNDAPVFSLTSPIIGQVNGKLKDPRSGTHQKNAYYLGLGEGVVQHMDDEISLLDIAPTILSILESPIPESYAGKVQAAVTGHGVR